MLQKVLTISSKFLKFWSLLACQMLWIKDTEYIKYSLAVFHVTLYCQKQNQQKLNKQKALATQRPQMKRKFTITKQIFILLKHSSWNTDDFLQIRLK